MSGEANARDRRAAGRERRRRTGEEEGQSEAVEDGNDLQLSDALKAAASSAAVAAAVGAARAFVARRHESDDERDEHEERDTAEEESEGDARQSPDAQAAPEQERAQDEPVAAEQQEQEEHEEEQQDEEEQPDPASPSELRSIVARARECLRELRGTDPEAVSSVRRSASGWVVGLEVVEVRRVPDSTDVLATYEVELDGEGRLVRFERTRRYHRSEAAGGGPG